MFRYHKSPKKDCRSLSSGHSKSYRDALETEVETCPDAKGRVSQAKETFSKLIVKSMPVFSLSNGL